MIVGIAAKIPSSNTCPRLAPRMSVIAVGAGCGGKKAWVTFKVAAIGIPRYINGISSSWAIIKIIGKTTTSPTSKNNANPMIKEARITATWIQRRPNLLINVVAIRYPPPASETNLPSIDPKPKIIAKCPNWPPIPVSIGNT